ncbi:MAG: hypothetical protein Q9184_007192, partial [Pyrenodesmia sp. 2 TL-2023]
MTDFDVWSQSGSSVRSWLAGQPENSEDYKPSESGDGEKSPQCLLLRAGKRRPLREVEDNSVLMPSTKGQQHSPVKREGKDPSKKQQQGSPEKKKKKDAGTLPSSLALRSGTRRTPDEEVFSDDYDQENEHTPKANRKTWSLNEVPKLDPPDVDARESRSQGGSTSTDRKRSPSPRKTRYNMTLAEIRVIPVAIGSGDAPFPEEMQQLYDDLIELQTRQGLLPASIRDRARQQLVVRDRDQYYSEESENTGR